MIDASDPSASVPETVHERPLISLAMADRLDVFSVPIATLSAKAILDEIAGKGRIVAPYTADRPALGGARGRTKTACKTALRVRT